MSAQLTAIVVDGLPEATRQLRGEAFWDAIARALPEALAPLLEQLAATAPRGRTGRLAADGFRAYVQRHNAGLIQGIDVRIWSDQGYAHLVAEGHRIVPRGPNRGPHPSRIARRQLRASLLARQGAGSTGAVPGNPWVTISVAQQRAAIVARLEAALPGGAA